MKFNKLQRKLVKIVKELIQKVENEENQTERKIPKEIHEEKKHWLELNKTKRNCKKLYKKELVKYNKNAKKKTNKRRQNETKTRQILWHFFHLQSLYISRFLPTLLAISWLHFNPLSSTTSPSFLTILKPFPTPLEISQGSPQHFNHSCRFSKFPCNLPRFLNSFLKLI